MTKESNQPQRITDVPDHILDKVADEAERYFNEDQARLLGGYSEDAKQVIQRISTHKKARDPKRRELYKQIILRTIGDKVGLPVSEKAPLMIFCGPAGAGKSTLRAAFDKDTAFDDPRLQEAKDIYRKNIDSCISIDFGLFKEMLPEYKAANTIYKEKFGDMYAVIRCEASGLNQAIRQFAKELNFPAVQEQLYDVNMRENKELDADARHYDMVIFGVTCDPEKIIERVKARQNPMQEQEVVRAIKGFSSDDAFGYISEIAGRTFLIDTNDKYKNIYYDNKKEGVQEKDAEALQKFKDLQKFIPQQEPGKEGQQKAHSL